MLSMPREVIEDIYAYSAAFGKAYILNVSLNSAKKITYYIIYTIEPSNINLNAKDYRKKLIINSFDSIEKYQNQLFGK